MVCRSDENMRFYIFLHFLTVFLFFSFCAHNRRGGACMTALIDCFPVVIDLLLVMHHCVFIGKYFSGSTSTCVSVCLWRTIPHGPGFFCFSGFPEMVCNLRLGAIWEGRGWNVIGAHSLTQFQPSFCNRAAYWIFLQACWCVIFCGAGERAEGEWESECGQHRQRPQHVKFIMSSSAQWTSGQLDILAQVPSNASFLRSDSTEPQSNTVALIRSFVLLYSGH